MAMNEMGSAKLEAAFRAAIYRVDLPEGQFDLRIGVADSAFDDCLRRRGVQCWGIVTAYNPGGVLFSADENLLGQARLCERLKGLGWEFFSACNLDPLGDWPPEPGCLVLDADLGRLHALARDFSQLALVCGERGLAPVLQWV